MFLLPLTNKTQTEANQTNDDETFYCTRSARSKATVLLNWVEFSCAQGTLD